MGNVYLFELDSVRNSPKEIEIAQKRLFNELLLTDNNIIITQNQLSDSKVFLTLLKSDAHYQMLMNMFRHGFLKVSIFKSLDVSEDEKKKEVRTASQYTQNAIKKALNETGDEDYVFSGIPITKEDSYLLEEIKTSLVNSDPELLFEDIKKLEDIKNNYDKIHDIDKYIKDVGNDFINNAYENYKNKNKDLLSLVENDIDRIKLFYKHVHIILLASKEKVAFTASLKSENGNDLVGNIERAVNDFGIDKCKYKDTEFKVLYEKAIKNLAVGKPNDAYNRSNWYNYIKENNTDKDVLALEEMIIDICYNFTCQFSISVIDSNELLNDINGKFSEKYFDELYRYYRAYKDKIHIVNEEKDKSNVNVEIPQDLKWEVPYEIRKDVEKLKKSRKKNVAQEWDKLVTRTQFWTPLLVSLALFLLFLFFNVTFNVITGLFENIVGISIISAVIEIVFLGLLSSLLAEKLHVVDILDIVRNFKTKFDCYLLYRKTRKENIING